MPLGTHEAWQRRKASDARAIAGCSRVQWKMAGALLALPLIAVYRVVQAVFWFVNAATESGPPSGRPPWG